MKPFTIIELDETTSTQTYLTQEDERKSFDEFTVITAKNQISGRGQGTNIWESENGKNICFSLLLKPLFLNPSEQFIITQIISLAIVDVLVKYGLQDVMIKWPNDIYVSNNKICGILIQNKIIGNQISHSYIGIGINVNQRKFLFAPNPTSLTLETDKTHDLNKFLNDTLYNIYVRYMQLKENKIIEIQNKYLSLLLFKGEWRKYIYEGREIVATILNVNEFGHLILQQTDETILQCELRQLQFLIKN